MKEGYFHRVHAQSPTRMWINNPTPADAQKAIDAGAIGATTNPTYSAKQLKEESEREFGQQALEEAVQTAENDSDAANIVQSKFVQRIMEVFLPLYEAKPGEQGFVSIQGDPQRDGDADHIIIEAMEYKKLGKNFIAKIPAIDAGIKAIERLVAEDIPTIATEIMGISQLVTVCEMYQKASRESGKTPPFYLTHITGIYDDHLKNVVQAEGIDISPDVLWQAGCIVARQEYRIWKERNYPGIILGGGARGLHHFTEFVGAEMHITINWHGTADKLIEENPPVVYRHDTPAPQHVVDELMEKLPDFRKAYTEDGLAVDEYAEFGPVVLFRNQFLSGWKQLEAEVTKYRTSISQSSPV